MREEPHDSSRPSFERVDRAPAVATATAPSLSFIVPAYNERLLIGATLDALHDAGRATGEAYEIVVADDASEDDTASIAEAHGATVVTARNRRISATRNVGARVARGQYLIFVDADTHVPAETAVAAVATMALDIPAGGCICTFDEPRPLWVRLIEGPLMWLYATARLTPGAFLFCTREAFDGVGGFDESVYGGEEVLMARALDRYARARGARFTILRETITTSGRKLRAYSAFELFFTLVRAAMHGGRKRRGMDLWYGRRRVDPARLDNRSGSSSGPHSL